MQLPKDATIVVADGETLQLFRNSGDERNPKLTAIPTASVGGDNKSGGTRHHSSAANPDESRLEEDSFAAATAAWLNREVLDGRIGQLVVIAPPKTLGELRKHYHKALEAKLVGELSKEFSRRPIAEIEAALANA